MKTIYISPTTPNERERAIRLFGSQSEKCQPEKPSCGVTRPRSFKLTILRRTGAKSGCRVKFRYREKPRETDFSRVTTVRCCHTLSAYYLRFTNALIMQIATFGSRWRLFKNPWLSQAAGQLPECLLLASTGASTERISRHRSRSSVMEYTPCSWTHMIY